MLEVVDFDHFLRRRWLASGPDALWVTEVTTDRWLVGERRRFWEIGEHRWLQELAFLWRQYTPCKSRNVNSYTVKSVNLFWLLRLVCTRGIWKVFSMVQFFSNLLTKPFMIDIILNCDLCSLVWNKCEADGVWWAQDITFEAGHEKMCLKSYANNKSADQPLLFAA